ncbi:MAG TPA: sialate O-acetylesterase, partial [Clostridia bacterium]|nr:sialate O-acetylesterase [Clostridia bacterium]
QQKEEKTLCIPTISQAWIPGMKTREVLFNARNAFLLRSSKLLLALLGAFVLCGNVLAADQNAERPFLHPLFSDHLVLQRGVKVPVWGWAAPGTKVTVSFAGQTKTAVAELDGKWMVRLNPLRVSREPRTMTITSDAGGNSVTIQDVLVGDVWLCSGQSNMEMGIRACDVPEEIAQANFPQIRLLTVPKQIAKVPVSTLQCQWQHCTPTSVAEGGWGGFSAAGYFFGRELYRQLNIPIGLIHSSWGGTIAEAWTSTEGLQPMGDFDQRLEQVANAAKTQPTSFAAEYEKWCQRNDPGTAQGWQKAEASSADWKSVTMPQPFEKAGLPDFDGMVWFHRTFELPTDCAGKDLKLTLGPVDDFDTTFINGVKVGQTTRHDTPRVYKVPANAVKAGMNTISVRVLDTGDVGGFAGKTEQMSITAPDSATISLAGSWQMRESAPLAKLPALPVQSDANNPNVVTVLYNGMIAPLLPFAIKGAIWYQGESNADRASQYRRLLPTMIQDWRTHFAVGDFPFYIVQLANFQPVANEPRDNTWAELREAQALTAKNVHNAGLAVAIDIGDAADIHPKNKAEVGRRLALSALAKTYGKKIEHSGPWYKSMKVKGNAVELSFDHIDGGLVAKDGELKGFAIAGEDRKFVWANAVIKGKKVIVSSPAVARPVAVRYAWDINPVCNLYNESGLPAVPFRTDDWPMLTQNRK